MAAVAPCAVPPGTLLAACSGAGAYADCFVTEIDRPVSHAQYVEAFYTTAVFKLERLLILAAMGRPSSDLQARQLAAGSAEPFAAWRVEARAEDQLLLADRSGRTRSWLMVAGAPAAGGAHTLLYFGSAVGPVLRAGETPARMGRAFHLLLGFHKLYSRILLSAAKRRLAA